MKSELWVDNFGKEKLAFRKKRLNTKQKGMNEK